MRLYPVPMLLFAVAAVAQNPASRFRDVEPLLETVQKDTKQIVTPVRTLSLRGNPLSATARSSQLPELEKRLFDIVVEKP